MSSLRRRASWIESYHTGPIVSSLTRSILAKYVLILPVAAGACPKECRVLALAHDEGERGASAPCPLNLRAEKLLRAYSFALFSSYVKTSSMPTPNALASRNASSSDGT